MFVQICQLHLQVEMHITTQFLYQAVQAEGHIPPASTAAHKQKGSRKM